MSWQLDADSNAVCFECLGSDGWETVALTAIVARQHFITAADTQVPVDSGELDGLRVERVNM